MDRNDYHRICKKSKIENTRIYCLDETGIRSYCNFGRSYSKKGKTPTSIINGKKINVSFIFEINNQGGMSFIIYEKTMNSQKIIELLEYPIKTFEKKFLQSQIISKFTTVESLKNA